MWQYLALLLAITIGLLIVFSLWHIKNLIPLVDIYSVIPLKRYLLTKEYKNLKAGDIIYTRSSITTVQEMFVPYIYKHIAIIVDFNDKLYIAETTGKGIIGRSKNKLIERNGGVDIYPLCERLKNIIGPIFISKLNKPLTPEKNDKLQDTVIDKHGESYPNFINLYTLFVLGIPVPTNLYCHTFVYECLINMGILDNVHRSAREIGTLLTSLSEYELNDGYLYEDPRQLIYDNECDEELF